MPLRRVFNRVVTQTRAQPKALHYAGATAMVAAAFFMRDLFDPLWGSSFPLVFGAAAVLGSAALFGGAAGFLATGLSAATAAYLYMTPDGGIWITRADQLAGLAAFSVNGTLTSLVLETLHRHTVELRAIEHHRALLLREFRHRTRNDLQSLASLLLLRARGAGLEARAALLEAAGHARALAAVHRHLERLDADDQRGAWVDTQAFVGGLCRDLDRSSLDGLRPVVVTCHAESHRLDTERAVAVGLVLNEAMTNALKFAFPGERHGTVTVIWRRQGDCFDLVVEDDGIGLPGAEAVAPGAQPSGGLGTRLLRGLAAQLRGSFRRTRGPKGGTCCVLSFPVEAPTLLPTAVGAPL